MRVKDVKKVVLAYSGGLDTSVILRWLQTTYKCEVITFTAEGDSSQPVSALRAVAITTASGRSVPTGVPSSESTQMRARESAASACSLLMRV